MSFVIVVCCQVQISAASRSLVQRSPDECGVSECDSDASKIGTPWPNGAPCAMEKKKKYIYIYDLNLYAPCILYIGQTYRYSPEYSFYIFSQQMYLIIIIIFFRISLTFFVYSSTKCLLFPNVILLGS